MTVVRRRLFILAVAVLATTAATLAQAATRVIDGDTIVVEGIGTVRLIEEFGGLQGKAAESGGVLWAASPFGYVAGVAAVSPSTREPQSASGTETVYVTRTGAKYHRAGCRSLARSQIPMSLKEAAARYGPCSLCRPPVLAATPAVAAAEVAPPTAATPVAGDSAEAATPVMVSRTGTKYHRAGCRTLRNGGIPTTLGEASTRYGPCSICRPSVLSATVTPATPATPRAVAPPPPDASGRCQAITKKGTQCSRRARPGSRFCWQHLRLPDRPLTVTEECSINFKAQRMSRAGSTKAAIRFGSTTSGRNPVN